MRKTLLALFSTLSVIALSGQITISDAYFPVPGDSLITTSEGNVGALIDLGTTGGDQTWDFSNLPTGSPQIQVFQEAATGADFASFPGTEVRSELANGTENYFNVTDTRFELVGFFGEDPAELGLEIATLFDPPIVQRWAPLEFGDLHTSEAAFLVAFAADDIPGGLLDSIDIDVDSLRVRFSTDRTDVVDAWGTLELPHGTYPVLRERRSSVQDIRLEAKISFLPWFDITDIILDLIDLPDIGLGETAFVNYYFWSDAAKEPIAVVGTVSEEDPTPTQVTYKYDPATSDTDTRLVAPAGLRLFPNPAIGSVAVQFSDLPLDFYRIELFNLVGQPVLRESYYIGGDHTTGLDLHTLHRGMYLVRLIDGQGRVVSTQRLLVTRP